MLPFEKMLLIVIVRLFREQEKPVTPTELTEMDEHAKLAKLAEGY